MASYRDEAVVLRTYKLGEADRIVVLLTKSHGQVRAVAKGVRRTSSKFGGRLEPFMVVDLQLYEGKSLDVIQQAETLGAYGGEIASDYAGFTAANVMTETAERLSSELSSTQQYLLLVGALRSLARRERAADRLLNAYLVKAFALAGWEPSFHQCVACGEPGEHTAFALSLGGVVCEGCRSPGVAILTDAAIRLLQAFLDGDWGVVDESDEASQREASGVIAAFSQWQLERGLKSLQHLERG